MRPESCDDDVADKPHSFRFPDRPRPRRYVCRCNRSAPAQESRSRRRAPASRRSAAQSPARRRWRGRSAPSVFRICGTPLTCTAPSFSSRSSADASSISAAALIALSRTATAARCTALPAVTVWRLANAPKPSAVPAVSPAITSMSSGLHAEHVADKLRHHGLDALALRARSGGDDDLARRADAKRRALERAAPGALDVVGEAETRDSARPSAPPAAAPGNPPSRPPQARGAGTPDSRRCRRPWSSRRAA